MTPTQKFLVYGGSAAAVVVALVVFWEIVFGIFSLGVVGAIIAWLPDSDDEEEEGEYDEDLAYDDDF